MVNFLIDTKASYTCGNMSLNFSGMIPNMVHLIIQVHKSSIQYQPFR